VDVERWNKGGEPPAYVELLERGRAVEHKSRDNVT